MGLAVVNLTGLDLAVLSVYLAAVIASGLLFKDRLGGTHDYFAAGGNMLWWMAGCSAVTSELSVWAFTGAAGRYAKDGLLLLYANLLSMATLPLLYWLGPRFRRLRVTTPLEAVRLRFGSSTEAFYSTLVIPLGIWGGAMGIHITAAFLSAATGVDRDTIVFVIGGFTVVMSALGGIWAVATSDLFQGILTLFTMLVLLAYTAFHPRIEAAGGMFQGIPREMFDPFRGSSPLTVIVWVVAMTLITLMSRLSVMHDGAKFVVARSEQDCCRMVTVILLIGLLMAPLIALPSLLAGQILDPGAVAAAGSSDEGVLAVLARKIMPSGLMGLMLAGIVAAAMNSMDNALNRNAGFFVTSVYQKVRRNASSSEAVRISRVATLVFGGLSMLIALVLNRNRQSGLFDFVLRANSLFAIPLMIPLALGLLFKRTPAWTGWGGVLVCAAVAWLFDAFFDVTSLLAFVGVNNPTPRDFVDAKLALQIAASMAAGYLFFAACSFAYGLRNKVSGTQRDEFWELWNRPLSSEESEGAVGFQRLNSAKILLGFGLGTLCISAAFRSLTEAVTVVVLASIFLSLGTYLWRKSRE